MCILTLNVIIFQSGLPTYTPTGTASPVLAAVFIVTALVGIE